MFVGVGKVLNDQRASLAHVTLCAFVRVVAVESEVILGRHQLSK